MKFQLGATVATAAVFSECHTNEKFFNFVLMSLKRHSNGDWGDLDPEDATMNDLAVSSGIDRIFSAYDYKEDPNLKIWIITEADRSATTVLFPSDY